MKNSYLFTLLKFILFLIILCFLVVINRQLFKEIRLAETLNIGVLYWSVLSSFAFYTFIADLNNLYKKIQRFFFRSSFFTLLFPALVILLGIAFFLLPKVLSFSFSKDIFLFLGGFIVTAHLIFVARELKGSNFTSFVNYLFIFSLLYIINIVLLGVYLKVAFKINLGKVIADGLRGGAFLIRDIFTQLFK